MIPCRRCLLEDMADQQDLRAWIQERNALLEENLRADEATRQQRLNACRSCDSLLSGTCALCGCYVELRAAKKNMRCPHVPDKWGL